MRFGDRNVARRWIAEELMHVNDVLHTDYPNSRDRDLILIAVSAHLGSCVECRFENLTRSKR